MLKFASLCSSPFSSYFFCAAGTLLNVEKAVEIGTPVVVMEGTGRVADLIAYAWRLMHDGSPGASHLTRAELYRRTHQVFARPNKNSESSDKKQQRRRSQSCPPVPDATLSAFACATARLQVRSVTVTDDMWHCTHGGAADVHQREPPVDAPPDRTLTAKLRAWSRKYARDFNGGFLVTQRQCAGQAACASSAASQQDPAVRDFFERILNVVLSEHKIAVYNAATDRARLDEIIIQSIANNLHVRQLSQNLSSHLHLDLLDLAVRFGRTRMAQEQLDFLQDMHVDSKGGAATDDQLRARLTEYHSSLMTALIQNQPEMIVLLIDQVWHEEKKERMKKQEEKEERRKKKRRKKKRRRKKEERKKRRRKKKKKKEERKKKER